MKIMLQNKKIHYYNNKKIKQRVYYTSLNAKDIKYLYMLLCIFCAIYLYNLCIHGYATGLNTHPAAASTAGHSNFIVYV